MKIGYELIGIPTTGPVEGQAKYAFYLARALLEIAPGDHFVFFHNSFRKPIARTDLETAFGTDRFDYIRTNVPFTDASPLASWLKYRLWTGRARRQGVKVFHGTSFQGLGRTVPPSVITVHDIAGALFPFDHIPDPETYKHRMLQYINAAAAVIVPSEHTKKDLVDQWNVSPGKVTAIHEGFIPPVDADADAEPQFDPPLPNRYLLYVGSFRVNKNIPRLLEAFAEVAGECADVSLVMVGGGGNERDVRERIRSLNFADRVRLLGHVSDAELDHFYRHAALLVQPSLYEGFGLTVLEAMGRGCPVVTSSATSLAEVAGDAALLVDARDPREMAAAMLRGLEEDNLRADLTRRGHERANAFPWRKTAEETRAVYQSVTTRT